MRGKSILTKWLSGILMILLTASIASADMPTPQSPITPEIIYVDDDATGANVGTSWEYAMNSLQDALLLAYFLEKPVEIRVAQGIYTPDKGIGIMPGDPSISFELMNGVTIKGGYAPSLSFGRGQTDVRDINQYESILSGDLEQNDGPDSTSIAENSYHVVTSFRTDQTAILDGLTITAGGNTDGSGRANDSEDNMGGGMYNNYGSPMLINCTFSENRGHDGAGVYNRSGSSSFIDCTFNGNSADEFGGGIFNYLSSTRLLNCAFIGNSANSEGGGMYNIDSSPVLTNCTFSENLGNYGGGLCNSGSESMLADCDFIGNSAVWSGGAVCNYTGISTFHNCTFKENSAVREGGGIYNDSHSRMNLTNCIFSRNSARNGGGISNTSFRLGSIYRDIYEIDNNTYAMFLLNCTFNGNLAQNEGGAISTDIRYSIREELTGMYNQAILINCILWGDTPDEIQETTGETILLDTGESIVAFYSNVQGGFPGEGNIDSDPLFADPDNGDYHLKSQAGRWDPTTQNWVIDQICSPCIDAGDPNIPIGLERFPNGGRINMGAYGGTPEASLSPRQLPGLPVHAYNPFPANEATDVPRDVILSWTPGKTAHMFNVYFGTNFDTVYQADINNPLGVLVSQNQDPNTYSPGRLNSGQIYYWRIDEVDSKGTTITGVVWTFTTHRPKGRACFTGQTGVWVNGELIPISKVAAAQFINCFNGIKKVEEVQEHTGTFTCYNILLESGNCITVAENHYFMIEPGRWDSLQELKAGTKLQTAKGTIGIKSITKQPELYLGKVYNLKIEGSDRYLVGEDAVIVRDY